MSTSGRMRYQPASLTNSRSSASSVVDRRLSYVVGVYLRRRVREGEHEREGRGRGRGEEAAWP